MRPSPVARVFAQEWPLLVATLMRDLGDLDLAEDVAQEAFTEAAARWDADGMPDRPGAWLLTTARRRAIDQMRRDQRFADRMPLLVDAPDDPDDEGARVDDQLALIFGCCHPSLARDAQIALTLREVCGLSTGQIASAFLTPEPTMAKRLVRAKNKIRAAGVPFAVPGPDRLPERRDAVLHIIYLIFTEGHTSSSDTPLLRGDLCDEARWLAGLLAHLLPDDPEVLGLAALLSFTDARRAARVDAGGGLILLEDQDRSLWDRQLIARGQSQLARALSHTRMGPYQLQAAIAGQHASATEAGDTDWRMIIGLYGALLEVAPSPVVELNRAVAVSMAEGAAAGLELLDQLADGGDLDDYRYLHAARADLLRQLGRRADAAAAYTRALALGGNAAERDFLTDRLADVS